MYNSEYFYGISDLMHFNVYAVLLKDSIIKEERVVIKVFKKDNQIVVIETNNFEDIILKDTRIDSDLDILDMDLVFLRVLERYYSDYEMPGMIYEYIEGVGSWFRVRVEGYNPEDKYLKPFYLKKKLKKDELSKYAKNDEELKKLNNLFDLTKGLIKFSKIKDVKSMFLELEK